jgi:hypothetical protein
LLKALQGGRDDVRAGNQLDPGRALHGRQNLGPAHADADHADLQCSSRCRHAFSSLRQWAAS